MTKHNEYGAELFLSAMERYQSGTSNIRAALRDAAKGYGEMHRHIVASNGGVEPKTSAMAGKLKDILTSRGPLATNCSKWIDDRNHRMALLWMDQNADKVAWVFSNSEASNPLSIYKTWQNYFRKTVKAEWEENEAEGGVEPKDLLGVALPGVTLDEVEAEWTRLAELKAKREEEKPVPEPEPIPEPTPVPAVDINPIMILRDYLLEANEKELDALQTLINERRERLKPVTPIKEEPTGHQMKEAEWVWNLSDAELTERMQSNPHRVIDFAVFRLSDPEVPVLTGRWAKSAKTLSVTTFDGRHEEVPHDIKTKISSRQLKIALGRYLGPGPGTFNGTTKYNHALTLERL
jgi:hypothetical protein